MWHCSELRKMFLVRSYFSIPLIIEFSLKILLLFHPFVGTLHVVCSEFYSHSSENNGAVCSTDAVFLSDGDSCCVSICIKLN